MKVGHAKSSVIVRLDPGDDILVSIETVCRDHGVMNAEITGLGSVESPTLAHYRRGTKKFTERAFEGVFEIASLVGNVAVNDGQPAAHCHVVISDAAMTPYAGHLVKGLCSATVELVIQPLESHYEKQLNGEIGLNLWQL